MTKEEYIGKYLDKKLKNHGLPYGMQYISLEASLIEKAEKNWERTQKKKTLTPKQQKWTLNFLHVTALYNAKKLTQFQAQIYFDILTISGV